MEEGAQVALRTKHLDAHHEDDEQLGDRHHPRVHPVGAVAEDHGRADREPHVGDPAAEGVDHEHPHRGAEDLFRPRGEASAARPALPERLERGEALEGVQELRGERPVGAPPPLAALPVPAREDGRRDQGEEREPEQGERDRYVQECEKEEHDEGGEGGDAELGQELAEPRFELLDALDEGHQHLAGAFEAEPRGTQHRHLVVEARPQVHLHPRRGAVGDHVAPVLEPAPEHHDRADQGELPGERGERLPREDPGEEPPEGGEPADPDERSGEADGHREHDPAAHPGGERPEPRIGQQCALPAPCPATGRPERSGSRPRFVRRPHSRQPPGSDAGGTRRSIRRSASSSTSSPSRPLLPMNPAATPASSRRTRGSK